MSSNREEVAEDEVEGTVDEVIKEVIREDLKVTRTSTNHGLNTADTMLD